MRKIDKAEAFCDYSSMRFYPEEYKPPHLRLAGVLKKQATLKNFFVQQPVDLVFLHGSLAQDDLKSLSDIDVAILYQKEGAEYRHRGIVVSKLAELFGREDIDLMILNSASPLACMQVLHNGKLLYCRKEARLKEFRLRTIQRYLATKYLRDFFNRTMQAAILGGR